MWLADTAPCALATAGCVTTPQARDVFMWTRLVLFRTGYVHAAHI